MIDDDEFEFDDGDGGLSFTNDERIAALLEQSEAQSKTVGELIGRLEKISSADNSYIERIDSRANRVLDDVEAVAKTIKLNAQLTRDDALAAVQDAAYRAVVGQLRHNISQDLQRLIEQQVERSISDMFDRYTAENKSDLVARIAKSQHEIGALESDLAAVRADTISTVRHINAEVKNNVQGVIQKTIDDARVGCFDAISGLKNTISTLDRSAKMAQAQSQDVFDGIENVGRIFGRHVYWYSGAFCLGFAVFVLIASMVVYNKNVPSEDEIARRKTELSRLYQQQQQISEVNRQRQAKFSEKYGAVLVRVDKNQCDSDGYCRIKNMYEN